MGSLPSLPTGPSPLDMPLLFPWLPMLPTPLPTTLSTMPPLCLPTPSPMPSTPPPLSMLPPLSTLLPTPPLSLSTLLVIWLRFPPTPTTMALPTTTPRLPSARLRATMAPVLLRDPTLSTFPTAVSRLSPTANDVDGYVAEVSYAGEAQYPDAVPVAHAV